MAGYSKDSKALRIVPPLQTAFPAVARFCSPPQTVLPMNENRPTPPSRRDFLTGRALRSEVERHGEALADELVGADIGRSEPTGGTTLRLATRAMACDFSVLLNPDAGEHLEAASNALDLIHQLEDQLSVYREWTELSQLNRTAAEGPVPVELQLFQLLRTACELAQRTAGAFDPSSGPLVALWRRARQEDRIPTESEIEDALEQTGVDHVRFDHAERTVQFDRSGMEINLGGIGKGYALDRAGRLLDESGAGDWLIHGGHSSLLARGDHNGCGGWPVGLRDPLLPQGRLATLVLRDCAFSTSGSGVQFFRHDGKRYGHILDPRTGWPVDGMLSVTVLAPTAAEADALSTAFFVMGVEKSREYCDNHKEVSALLIPPPRRGRRLEPINCGIPEEVLFFAPDGVSEER